jgi:hypothetical protein
MYLDATNELSYSGSGATWKDISGNNNDAILTGDTVSVKPIWFSATTTGNAGNYKAFSVNSGGTTDSYFKVLDTGGVNSVNFTTGYTMQFWVKMNNNYPGYKSFANKQNPDVWGSPYGDYNARLNGTSDLEIWTSDYGNHIVDTNPDWVSTQWYQLTVSWSVAGQYNVYRNTSKTTYSGPTLPIVGANYPLWIGSNLAGEYMSGDMGVVRFYNRVLTDDEVQRNYAYDRGKFQT